MSQKALKQWIKNLSGLFIGDSYIARDTVMLCSLKHQFLIFQVESLS